MRAPGFRPATPALAKMLEIATDHACDAVGQHTPVGLPSPQSLLLSSTIDAIGRCSQDLPGRHQASNRHRARCGRVLSLPRLRALQVCRRRPTLGVVAVPHGRHPQTFTTSDENCALACPLSHSRSTRRSGPASHGSVALNKSATCRLMQRSKLGLLGAAEPNGPAPGGRRVTRASRPSA
jgi:hypothetical protein